MSKMSNRGVPGKESDPVLRTGAAAKYLSLSSSLLNKMRVRDEGPRFIKLTEKAIGYLKSDLDEWVQSRRVDSGSVSL